MTATATETSIATIAAAAVVATATSRSRAEGAVFDYIRPDENRLSDILADLLDPLGVDAQGPLFVRRFFEHMGIRRALADDVLLGLRVRREAVTTHLLANRRIDLTLEVGSFAVGVSSSP